MRPESLSQSQVYILIDHIHKFQSTSLSAATVKRFTFCTKAKIQHHIGQDDPVEVNMEHDSGVHGESQLKGIAGNSPTEGVPGGSPVEIAPNDNTAYMVVLNDDSAADVSSVEMTFDNLVGKASEGGPADQVPDNSSQGDMPEDSPGDETFDDSLMNNVASDSSADVAPDNGLGSEGGELIQTWARARKTQRINFSFVYCSWYLCLISLIIGGR